MWGYAALSRLRENNFSFNLALCLVLGASLPFFRELTNRHICIAAQNLAKYSYGIYLCHYPLMWFFYRKLSDLSPAGQHLGFVVSPFSFHSSPITLSSTAVKLERGCWQRDMSTVASRHHPPPASA
jgi:peptidoglycan/LPS O-acetylase OafA/YrhL